MKNKIVKNLLAFIRMHQEQEWIIACECCMLAVFLSVILPNEAHFREEPTVPEVRSMPDQRPRSVPMRIAFSSARSAIPSVTQPSPVRPHLIGKVSMEMSAVSSRASSASSVSSKTVTEPPVVPGNTRDDRRVERIGRREQARKETLALYEPVVSASSIPTVLPLRQAAPDFPLFGNAVHPVREVPNWGAMRTPSEWDRPYRQMKPGDFVAIPTYNLADLTVPLATIAEDLSPENVRILTTKLYYSTRFFGAYDLDAHEFSGVHPGMDLKLALGTPVGAVAGGRVQSILKDANMGLHVIIEHRAPSGEIFFSIYGHLNQAWVQEGQDVASGEAIGTVGMSGNTSAPHLHLQVDRDSGERPHVRYWPGLLPSPADADLRTIHPIRFIADY